MLTITIPGAEWFDETKNEFVTVKEQTLQLEHSLVSLSKWESKWRKSFYTKEEKTSAETLHYIKCMTITKNVDPSVYLNLTKENFAEINAYIEDPMTATTISERGGKGRINGERITSELIYYWMFSLQIPKECEKWHLNRLLTLIRVFNVKNQPASKTNAAQTARDYAALNEARKKKFNTKG